MIFPIPVDLTVNELEQRYNMTVEELNQSMPIGMETNIVVSSDVPQEIYDRLDRIESQESYWNEKYDEANPPPYPVKSVDARLGYVTLSDLYDITDSLSYEEIASIFE